MGFWGWVCGGVKSVCSAVVSTVKAVVAPVARVVSSVVSTVATVVTKAVDTVSRVVDTITQPLQRAVSWVGEKLNQAKNWVLEQTAIGRGIKSAYNWVMDETFIGTGIKWIGDKYTQCKQWVAQTPFGQFVQKLAPIVNIAGLVFGGVPGLLGKAISYTSSALNVLNDPTSLIPGITNIGSNVLNKGKDFIQNNRFVKNVKDSCSKLGKDIVNKGNDIWQNNKVVKVALDGCNKVKGYCQKAKDLSSDLANKGKELIENNQYVQGVVSGYNKVKYSCARAKDYGSNLLNGAKELLGNNPIAQGIVGGFNRTTQFINDKVIQHPVTKKVVNGLGMAKDKIIEVGRSYLPSLYNTSKKLYSPLSNWTGSKLSGIYNRFKTTRFGSGFDKVFKFSKKYVYKPLCWTSKKIKDWVIVPPCSYLFNKLSRTDFYRKYLSPVSNSIQNVKRSFQKIKNQANHQQAKNLLSKTEYKEIFKKENKINGIDSSNLMASYSNKFGCNQKAIIKLKQKFVNVNELKNQILQNQNDKDATQSVPSINSLVDSGKVKIQSLSFDARSAYNESYTIGGRLNLKNMTNEKVDFEVLPGQMFGCSVAKTSQHTVVRGLKSTLNPLQKKEIKLEAFCGDSGLSWPYKDSHYNLTNYVFRNFRQDIDQNQVWKQIS